MTRDALLPTILYRGRELWSLARVAVAAHVDSSLAAWLLDQKREWYDLAAGGPLDCERHGDHRHPSHEVAHRFEPDGEMTAPLPR